VYKFGTVGTIITRLRQHFRPQSSGLIVERRAGYYSTPNSTFLALCNAPSNLATCSGVYFLM
jgi:hypothetical protein